MAYLSYWIVLEKGLKIVDKVRRSEKLYCDICAWKDYLEEKTTEKPKDIKSFSMQESEKIPDVKLVLDYLGNELTVVMEIMNTTSKSGSTKWRDKRNGIRIMQIHSDYQINISNTEIKLKMVSLNSRMQLRITRPNNQLHKYTKFVFPLEGRLRKN